MTPLHYCARAGHLEVVKLLVEAGASPGDKSVEGKTPIVLAVASEHVDVYNYLINKKHDSYKLLEDKKVRKQRCGHHSSPRHTCGDNRQGPRVQQRGVTVMCMFWVLT